MSLLLRLTFLSFAIFSSVCGASTVPESPPSRWNPGSYGVSASTEFYSSNANYDDARGSFSRLSGGRSLSVFETRPRVRYAFAHALSAFAGTSYAQTKAIDLTTEKTNANVNEVFGGVDFQMNRRWWRVIPELEFSYPVVTGSVGQTAAMTSDGVWYMRAGVFLFKPYKRVRFESYLGFYYPGEGLAKRFLYSLSTELALVDGFSLGGGVSGYETVLTDEKTKIERQLTNSSANAGSEHFWAYDPALLDAKAWLGFRADRAFSFRLGYAQSLNGVRSAAGSAFMLTIAFNSPGDKERGEAIRNGYGVPEEIDESAKVKGSDEFKAEPEVIDPELFEQKQKSAPKSPNLDSTEKILENRQ
jgi:hypothetical protein